MRDKLEPPPPGYRPHDARSLRDYLAGKPGLAARLGGNAALWRIEEVGDVCAFMVSDMSRAISGQQIHVDSGYSIMGVTTVADPAGKA